MGLGATLAEAATSGLAGAVTGGIGSIISGGLGLLGACTINILRTLPTIFNRIK